MLVGVDYYPEHWPEERWPVDARLMREAGIGVARMAEFAWCRLEPREERFSFAWLDRALDVLDAQGVKAVLGTPTATPPAWLHERYPSIYPADPRGYRLGFGTRLQRCLNHPHMREHSRRITRAMAEHFADHPAVIGWQTDNEFEANLCYCPVCADAFRDWLRARYGTLDALNAAWGSVFWSQEYSGWSQIPLPWEARCGQSHNPSLWLDYRRFASESTVAFQREQVRILRAAAPRQWVTHNFMGLHESMDYYALAADLDFVSWDNYPGGDWQQEWARPDLAHDAMRGLKRRGFWVMEEQCGITGWERMARRPRPGQVRAWAWQAVGHGAEAVVFFRWRSCLFGTEQYWHGVLNHDGEPRRRYREVARFAAEAAALSEALEGSVVRARAAVLNSYEQNWAYQIQPQADGLEWWRQARRYHAALRARGLDVDVVPIEADLSAYRVVAAPGWYIVTPEDAARLEAYVLGGGTLLLSPRTGVKDAANLCRPEPLPALLREVAGVEVDDYDALGAATERLRLDDGRELDVTVWADALRLLDAEAAGHWASGAFEGEPALTRRRHGAGTVWYVGTFGGPDLYAALLDRVLPEAGLPAEPGVPDGVDVSRRVKDGVTYLFLVNMTGEERRAPVPTGAEALLGPAPAEGYAALPGREVGVYRCAG
ncbi:MAG: beta-galactosidase [Chthonomonadales bacterium]|nr:beta-galactosidase [Chthonomonadales bacterium]